MGSRAVPARIPVVEGNGVLRLGLVLSARRRPTAGAGRRAHRFRAAERPLRWSYRIEIVAMLAMGVMMSFDLARNIDLIPLDSANVRIFHVPILLCALGAVIFERHVAAIWRMEHIESRYWSAASRRRPAKSRPTTPNGTKSCGSRRLRASASAYLPTCTTALGASLVASAAARAVSKAARTPKSSKRVQGSAAGAAHRDRRAGAVWTATSAPCSAILRYRLEPSARTGRRAPGVGSGASCPTIDALEAIGRVRPAADRAGGGRQCPQAFRMRRVVRLSAPRRRLTVSVEIWIEDDGRGFDTSLPLPPALGSGQHADAGRAHRRAACEIHVTSRATEPSCVCSFRAGSQSVHRGSRHPGNPTRAPCTTSFRRLALRDQREGGFIARRGLQQPQFGCTRDRGGAGTHGELAIAVLDVARDRVHRDAEPVADLGVVVAAREQAQDIGFAGGQRR